MKRFMHLLIVLTIASIAAKFVTEKFVIKSDDTDPDGFILQTAGPGLDDLAVGVTFALTSVGAIMLFGPH